MLREFIDYTGMAILLFWVLTHSAQFGTVIGSLTSATQSGVRTL